MSEVDFTDDEVLELRGVWMSRRMFGWMVEPSLAPFYAETRSFPEYLDAVAAVRVSAGEAGDGE